MTPVFVIVAVPPNETVAPPDKPVPVLTVMEELASLMFVIAPSVIDVVPMFVIVLLSPSMPLFVIV